MTEVTEIKSLASITSSTTAGPGPLRRARWRNVPLHERCSTLDMLKMKDAFDQANLNKLLPTEFRNLLLTQLNVEYDDEEFKLLFLKINTNRDGAIGWDEMVSHLLLGYFAASADDGPLGGLQQNILGLPTVLRSRHRQPISRICFCPDVSKNRQIDFLQGMYVTISSDGLINWWSLDMVLLRTAFSTSPHLKLRTTWVTDMVCMPDVNIVVTSSTERELRFYDCTAKKFILKIVITSWEYMICTMYYHFSEDINEDCLLICGDVGGNIRVLMFSPVGRGPFVNRAERPLIQLRHIALQKHPELLPELRLREFPNVHSDWVRQVSFYPSLHCLVSCATCPDSLLMADLAGSKTYNMFKTEKGIQCFAFTEETHILVTGGPDCTVRVWSPFVPSKANLVFTGHRAAVTSIVLQNGGNTIYSLSRDRIIRVWDIQSQLCLQTYIEIPAQVGEHTPISAVYNPATREYILGSMKIAVLILDEQLNANHTDGYTHSRAVSNIMYNPLFKLVITCGMDSIIMNWNIITGKCNVIVRDAHTRKLHGELIPVEITAACFDPGYQLMVSGARTGELKIWNFNSGVCLRTMGIEYMNEVTSCFWIEGRILAVGWNKHVTEFEDTGMATTGKDWEVRHTDDVLASAVRPPLTIATASYNSELLFWRLETGQPYRQFSCTEPMMRIKMSYSKREQAQATQQTSSGRKSSSKPSSMGRPSSGGRASIGRPSMVGRQSIVNTQSAVAKARARRVSSVQLPMVAQKMRKLAVHACIFLQTRPIHMRVASLIVALENGKIQCWSDHSAGGFQGAFQGVHTVGDYVSALGTDNENEYLFTGTTMGYIKTWLLKNYLVNETVHVNMPRLRLQFPFLWKDRLEGRAKRCVRDQPLPLLLNSYRGHLRCISCIAYIDDLRLVLRYLKCLAERAQGHLHTQLRTVFADHNIPTSFVLLETDEAEVEIIIMSLKDVCADGGSSDYSVRVWRLSGEYLQTLGTFLPWSLDVPRCPPDIKKVASFTTLKVLRSGYVSRYAPGQVEVDKLRDITELELSTKTFGAVPEEPLLGNYYMLPKRPERQDPIVLDDSLQTIPLYNWLRMASTTPVRRPPTPPLVKETRLKAEAELIRKAHFQAQSALHAASTCGPRHSVTTVRGSHQSISGSHHGSGDAQGSK